MNINDNNAAIMSHVIRHNVATGIVEA